MAVTPAIQQVGAVVAFALAALAMVAVAVEANDRRGDKPAIDFEHEVRPILAERCFSCHGPDKQKAHLRLDRRRDAFKDSDNGIVIVPGKASESRLFQLVSGADPEVVMPPKGDKLSEDQVGILKAWIEAGASWPEDGADDPKKHWAFQPPVRPEPPTVGNSWWV